MKDSEGRFAALLAKAPLGIKGISCVPVPTILQEGWAQPEAESLPKGLNLQEAHSCPKAGMRTELAWQKMALCLMGQWKVPRI